MHNSECEAYDLMKDLKKFPLPKIYHLERRTKENQGLIVMEDLSAKGASLGIFFSVTQEQCFNLARHIADFQTYVDFMPGKPWKGKFTNNMHAKPDVNDIWKNMLRPILDSDDKGVFNI